MDEIHPLIPIAGIPDIGPLKVEWNATAILNLYEEPTVERTRDVIQIELGGNRGVVLLVTADAIEVRLPTTEWTMGAYGPAPSSRFWKRFQIGEDGELTDKTIRKLVRDGMAARRAEFKKCKYCGKEYPPEHRTSENVCHGCASQYEGVVF